MGADGVDRERSTLVGVIAPVCNEFDVPFMACRGYMSMSAQYVSAKRIEGQGNRRRRPVVFHLGDHDPSGIDMTRDNQDRLRLLSNDYPVDVKRLALNMDQVEEYDPPPNPAKLTDSRIGGYMALYGESSWELDALEPKVISELISDALFAIRDHEKFDAACALEKEHRRTLRKIVNELRQVDDEDED